MHLEEFAEGTTLLHRVDPRVKFLTAGPLIILTALMQGLIGPSLSLTVAIGLAIAARLDPLKLGKRLLAVNVFIIMLWMFLPLSVPGEAVFYMGSFVATREGLMLALSITLKSNAIVLISIAVFGTTEVMSLAHALVHLHVPPKLVYLFFFFYRYLSLLHEEYTRLRNAMAVRGFRASTNTHTYRSLGNLVGMLLVNSFERSGRIYGAMLCRGFHGHFPVMRHFHLHSHDFYFGGFMLLTTILIAAREILA